MSKIRIRIIGEGKHEIGTRYDCACDPANLPPLACLTHRILGEPADVEYAFGTFKHVKHIKKAPGHGMLARKVMGAIRQAQVEGNAAAVVLKDRDRKSNLETIEEMRRGRDATSSRLPCALGTAVETFDAWMIVDGGAINQAGGDGSISHGDPETLDGKEGTGEHPKDRAAEIFGGQTGLGDKYAVVARHVDLDMLERQCPQGFKPFADEIRRHVGPLVGRKA